MIPPRNYLVAVDDMGTTYFTFAPSPASFSIIGNTQQEQIKISYDTVGRTLGFGPDILPVGRTKSQSSTNIYTCLLLCFMLVLAFLVLGFATFDALSGFVVMWLHLMPMRSCLDVTLVGCLTPSLHVTKLSKNQDFLPSTLD